MDIVCTEAHIVNNCYLRMVYGNCIEGIKQLVEDQMDLVLADPPYGDIVTDSYDKINSIELADYLINISQYVYKALKLGGSFIIFGGIGKYQNRAFFKYLSDIEFKVPGFYIRDVITWKKNKGYGAATRYLFTREEIVWLVKGEKPAYFDKPYLAEKHSAATKAMLKNAKYKTHSDHKRRSNVWTDIKEIMRNKIVSAQKPIDLYDVLIETHCPELGNIVDLFGGSGNSAISANKLNRNIMIFEKDPEVFEKMMNNIKSNT